MEQCMTEDVRIIVTARALIYNDKNELLLVKNEDSELWFTPGGWLSGFETLEEACIREVKEELGITVLPIKFVKVGYFQLTAEENIKWKQAVNKIEHYFLCTIAGGNLQLDPNGRNLWQDEDRGNTAFAKFFSKDELAKGDVSPEWIKRLPSF